jgi:hypothetical protein
MRSELERVLGSADRPWRTRVDARPPRDDEVESEEGRSEGGWGAESEAREEEEELVFVFDRGFMKERESWKE